MDIACRTNTVPSRVSIPAMTGDRPHGKVTYNELPGANSQIQCFTGCAYVNSDDFHKLLLLELAKWCCLMPLNHHLQPLIFSRWSRSSPARMTPLAMKWQNWARNCYPMTLTRFQHSLGHMNQTRQMSTATCSSFCGALVLKRDSRMDIAPPCEESLLWSRIIHELGSTRPGTGIEKEPKDG